LTNRKSVNQFDRKQIEEEIDRFSMVPFSSLKKRETPVSMSISARRVIVTQRFFDDLSSVQTP
jgi:hypothetical protein